ncbi:MAG: DNA polymerase/3'-5' exonuclease PolX [Candidatus Polarisedimenticolia bacterium]
MKPTVLDRKQVATVLEEIGALLELKGENPFKARAYLAAARALDALEEDLGTLLAEGRLRGVKGIGEAISAKITTLATTGRLPYHDDLRREIPAGLLEMIQVPGLGPRRARVLHQKLGIDSVDGLAEACRAGRLAGLGGFGAASQEKILQGIAFVKRHVGYMLLSDATRLAHALVQEVSSLQGVSHVQSAGSLRRRKELVRDIDLLASHKKGSRPEAILRRFTRLPSVRQVLGAGETKASVLTDDGRQVDLRVVSETELPFALLYFTGSADHNIALRRRAQSMGLKINEYGLWQGTRRLACRDEAAIFARLGLAFIPPELREDWGEIEAAASGELPDLVRLEDLRGVLHVHTNWSDGTDTLEDMVKVAAERGDTFVGISDHSRTAAYAGGLSLERVAEQRRALAALRRRYTKLTILHGTESDILKDGSLDYPAEVLDAFDFVIGSVHSHFSLPEQEQTARVVRAIANPHLTCVGHPTGRLLLQREGFSLDMEKVMDAAARHGKLIELNAQPHRLDIDWRACRRAAQKGVKVSINPDAHSLEEMEQTSYGIDTARRGWLTARDVANTRPWKEIRALAGSRA